MKYITKIGRWLESQEPKLAIGARSLAWIESMESDLKRWGMPARVRIINPVVVKGKVPVELIRVDSEQEEG